MKTTMIKTLVICAFFSSSATLNSWAQCREVKWPENKALAEEKVALYGDAMKQGDYPTAASAIQWIYKNAPDWNLKLYVDGAKIYDKLAEQEKDQKRRNALVDTLLWIYDQRIKYCGDEVNVLNRKAFSAYKYHVTQPDKAPKVLLMYDSLANISKDGLSDNNLVPYMTAVQAVQIKAKNLSEESILNRYDRIITMIDKNIAALEGKENEKSRVEKLREYRSSVDDILITLVKVDCNFVKKNLEPKFRKNPTDLVLAKKIFNFMLQGKCTEDPLWLEAGEVILSKEKDFVLVKNLALRYVKEGNMPRGEALLKEGLTLAKAPSEKADIYIYLGGIEAKKGDKAAARQYFLQANATSTTEKRGYEEIGDLFYSSFEDCAKRESMAEDRLVYIAAYNMYKMAGASQKMAQARAQFPSKEDIFLLNWKAGDAVRIGCWIGETVILDTRD